MQTIPVDLKRGEMVAVWVEVPVAGQVIAVAVKDPSGGDLLTFRSAEGREVRFVAPTDGRYVLHLAPMAKWEERVVAIVRIYDASP